MTWFKKVKVSGELGQLQLGVQFFFLNDETVNFQHPVVNNADCSDSKAMTVGFEPAALMPSTFPMS